MSTALASSAGSAPIQHQFNPYSQNGGTSLALAGEDFAILAADTRHSTGYSINSRNETKVFKINKSIVMSANGFSADQDSLVETTRVQVDWYEHNQNKPLVIESLARLMRSILYRKRMFPYYCETLLAGLDKDGKGAVYSFDFAGSYERSQCMATGSSSALLVPFLDNQINSLNQMDPATGEPRKVVPLALEEAIKLIRDAFSSITERNIYDGDGLDLLIVTKNGIEKQHYDLKRD